MQDSYQDQTTQIYDAGAQAFKESTENLEDFGGMLQNFKKCVATGKILDIGCAYGRHMEQMQQSGFDVYGVELSKELISLADPELGDKITQGSMLDIESFYSPEYFSGIISSASIVHMDKTFGVQVLQSAYKLLETKGFLYLAFVVRESASDLEERIKSSKTIPGCNKKYVYYGENEMDDILTNIGFEKKKEFISTPHNDTWKTIIAQKI